MGVNKDNESSTREADWMHVNFLFSGVTLAFGRTLMQ